MPDEIELLRQACREARVDFDLIQRIGRETGAGPELMREVVGWRNEGSPLGSELIRKMAAARAAGLSADDMASWALQAKSTDLLNMLDEFVKNPVSKEAVDALVKQAGIPENAGLHYTTEAYELARFLIENNLTWDPKAVPYGGDLNDLKRRIKLHAAGDPQSILYYAYDAYRTPTGDPSASQLGAAPTPLLEDSAPAPARTATGGSRPQGSIAAGMPGLPAGAGQPDIPVGQESSPGPTATGGPANPEGSAVPATPIIGLEKGNAPAGQGVFSGPIV